MFKAFSLTLIKIKLFFAFVLLFFSTQSMAVHAISLYDVDILVSDESKATRQQAFNHGLDEVFVRIAGDSIVMDKLKRPPASRYVRQFSYVPVEKPEINDAGEVLSHHLKIQYNGSLMEKYLRDNGFPVWGEHRPDVVIWLAVRDGKNEYVLKDTDRSLLKSAADKALVRRGIPERWPLYDYKDRKILSVADIRGGFKDPVSQASKRYTRGPALTGSMIWNGRQWQSSWSLLMNTGDRHWSIVDADYNKLINKAIDRAADAMGEVFAIRVGGKSQPLVRIQLDVQAVNSIGKYRRVEDYLADLNVVQSIKPVQIDGQRALFEITLRGSEADFLNIINSEAELVEIKVSAPQQQPVPEPAPETLPGSTGSGAGVSISGTQQEPVSAAVNDVPETVQKALPLYHYRYNR